MFENKESRVGYRDPRGHQIKPGFVVVLFLAVTLASACVERAVICGDGRVCPLGSECSADGSACVRDGCGNGVLDRGEQCDDGNIESGDGCTGMCRVEVAAGGSHTCAILEPDRLQCWGLGSSRQLGRIHATTIGDDEPGLGRGIHLGGKAKQVVAGDWHSCALMEEDGAVRCWGWDNLGYSNRIRGIGDDEHPILAGEIDVGGKVTQLAAGQEHTCALMKNGSVRCWGDGGAGKLGYPGMGDIGYDEHPYSAGDVHIGGHVVQIAAGSPHTCAVLKSGDLRCWGYGGDGRLGYGNTNNIGDDELPSTAGNVAVGGAVQEVAAGGQHTCALMQDGAVRCWGKGRFGSLGYGNTENIGDDEAPSSAGDIDLGGPAVQVVTGDAHTCALMATGAVRCWGYNSSGELGRGMRGSIGDDEHPSSSGDIDLGGKAVRLAAGRDHTCALMDDSAARCWGGGRNYRLGYGNRDDIGDDEAPSTVGDIDVGGPIKAIAAGVFHTCALLKSGAVRCWGEGEVGRLGHASTRRIGDGHSPGSWFAIDMGGDIGQVATGRAHTCALRQTGAVHCWGAGGSGQLGVGYQVANEPAGTPGLAFAAPVAQIAAGQEHSCALLHNGVVQCWGGNEFGQLGHGRGATIERVVAPGDEATVDLGGLAIAIAAGAQHTCALLESGAVRCWGDNADGQLGLGQPDVTMVGDDEIPAVVSTIAVGGAVQQIATGSFHTCVLLEGGDVRCWGRNQSGQLGLANRDTVGDDEAPTQVAAIDVGGESGSRVIQLAAGDAHTCALVSTGSVRCWGEGNDGRLGLGNTDSIGDDEHPATVDDVQLGGRAIAIAIGGAHSCAMLEDRSIVCWGSGRDGRLGHGNTDSIGDDESPESAGPVPAW